MPAAQPPAFTLRQIAYLVAAADIGTVVGAAGALHVSPSAVSDAITELERSLDTRLCVRRKAHGLTLTSAGTRLVRDGRRLLQASRELEGGLRAQDDELVGPIEIACYPALAPLVLPPVLHDFARAHPRVELSIRELTYDQLEGRLESGEVDVAFVYDRLVPGNPRRAQLYAFPQHILLPADHRLADAAAVRLEDVVEEDLVLYDAPPSSEHTLGLFAARGLHPRVRYRIGSFEAVRTLVGRGVGYGILVQRPVNQVNYEGNPVVMKTIDPPVPPVGVDIIWPADLDVPERTKALIAFVRSLAWPGAETVDRAAIAGAAA